MTTARLLSGPPLVEFPYGDERRRLEREVVIDLGERVPELERWAEERGFYHGPDWRVRRSGAGDTVVRVAAGMVYDGASIHALAQVVMGPKELYEIAAVIHDAFYRWQVPRDVSDHVFWLVARSGSRRVGSVRGALGWAALRALGWRAYRRHGGERGRARDRSGP